MLRLGWLRRVAVIGWKVIAEAVIELLIARLLTLLPPRVYLPRLNAFQPKGIGTTEGTERAMRVGRDVESVARHMPIRTLCLQKAIATQRMLVRRQLPATLCLGVNVLRERRIDPRRGLAAHAWVCVGESIVCGDDLLEQYAVVARYPSH